MDDYFNLFSEDAALREMHLSPQQAQFLMHQMETSLRMPEGLLGMYLNASADEDAPTSGFPYANLACAHIMRELGVRMTAATSGSVLTLCHDKSAQQRLVREMTCTGTCMRCDDQAPNVHGHCLRCSEEGNVSCLCMSHLQEHFDEKNQLSEEMRCELDGDRGHSGGDDSDDERVERTSEEIDEEADNLARHGVMCIASGGADEPCLVFFCASCRMFAPLLAFLPTKCDATDVTLWTSADCADRILSRLLLICDAILTFEKSSGRQADWDWISSNHAAISCEEALWRGIPDGDCAAIFLHVNELFPENDELNLHFEEGVEETVPCAVASGVFWIEEGLRVTLSVYDEALSGGVEGYFMRFPSPEVVQEKLNYVCDRLAALKLGSVQPVVRWIYLQSHRQWARAYVFSGMVVPEQTAELRGSFVEEAVLASFPPVPALREQRVVATSSTFEAATHWTTADVACPLSADSRTIAAFLRMLTIGQVMAAVGEHSPPAE